MGVESRKAPPLPAPTETDSTTGGTEVGGNTTDFESRVTEKSSYSLPEDGSPVTIATRRKKSEKDGHGLTSNKSQTSLLIEYFEGGKGSQSESRRPSVRVKVTPSSKGRNRTSNDHIQITERKGTRKASYTKRIQLSTDPREDRYLETEGDDTSLLSYRSATEESNVTSRGGGPIEVEIMPRRHGSPLIPHTESKTSSRYVQQATSDISSLPADSFLDGNTSSFERKRSRSLSRSEALAAGAAGGLVAGAAADKLRTPSRRRSRSLSRERIIAQKTVEKVKGESSSGRRRKHSSRSRSVSAEQVSEVIKSPRRRSSRSHNEESMVSGADSSLLNSHLSGKSGDAHSFRSGTSKSSINNPKLLETVEDAIRRLILPELTALKREQSKRHDRDRDRDRRSSITSGSGVSRESRDDGSSLRQSELETGTDVSRKPKVVLNDSEVISGNSIKGRKDKINDRARDSPRSFERGTSEDTVVQDTERDGKKRSIDKHRALEAAAAGAALGALTSTALHKQSQDSLDGEKKERRRRRTKSRSRSDSFAETYEEHEREAVPPMPLMSEINPSEITRSSILSVDSERPHSASQERVTPVREVPRGVVSPGSRTPTKTPVALQQGLGTQHSNFSRGNLSLHSEPSEQQLRGQEYDIDEHGRKVPMQESPRSVQEDDSYVEENNNKHSHALEAGLAGAAAGAGLAAMHHHHQDDIDDHEDPELLEDENYIMYQNTQTVPPPLRYIPYAQERRGLSPIQSVSGYTEGEPDQRDSRLTRSTGSYSSLARSAQHKQSRRSMKSLDSLGHHRENPHDFPEVRHGGLTDSELTQDAEYWEEQHRENDRNREFDEESYRSTDPRVDYKHMTNYTDDSMDGQHLDRVTAGQNVRGLGANPNYVHTPVAVESAVASLVDASQLTGESGRSGNHGQYDRRGSYASYEDGSENHFTSHSPTKNTNRDLNKDIGYGASDQGSRQNSPAKYRGEYDLDENGRKVAMPQNSHAIEKTLATEAAAAVLAGRNRRSAADEIRYEDRDETSGAPLHKSFKDRAMEVPGQIPSPRHSIDAPSEAMSHEQLKMGASGLPDLNDPMPEIGAWNDGESDVLTNPSVVHGPISGTPQQNTDHWPGKPTPPQQQFETNRSQKSDPNLKAAEAALIGAAAGMGGAAALAHHNQEASPIREDEWRRNSADRKRDTLITNPYEGTSPIAAIGGGLDRDRDILGQSGLPSLNNGFAPTKLAFQDARPSNSPRDEGYISSAPNNRSPGAVTPEPKMKGVGFLDQDHVEDADMAGGDPFYSPKHQRHLSGMSHGMGSPFYDSATGNGIDRIQSKDIVALMDHLTVRDAQRSARDTEILVTLVRAAAEMRNSFEDMKRLLADTEDVIITEVKDNTERSVQKVINGPRPQPASGPRSLRQGSQDDMYEDIPAKKRNVFRRALKGLSMKSSNDLGKIEEMLVQLLGEVEGLKVAQGLKPSSQRAESFDDRDLHHEGNYENDQDGYEPEGNAGTSNGSQASQSGHLSLPQSRGPGGTRPFDSRKFSDHRISTVPEDNEEDDLEPEEEMILNNQFDNNEGLLTPTRDIERGGSVPLGTPPQQYVPPASLSNENTPKTGTDKSKKHKSSSSSGWIPKISRWSETTTSSVFRGFRKGGRKSDDQYASPPSRSASDLGNYEHEPYGDDKLHSGFSQEQIQQYNENHPLGPLLPPEDPKYKAHRNSLNLQHPQPRPGHRYQTALESQAVNFDSPMSPKSVEWGSQVSLHRLPQQQTNRYSTGTNNTGNRSPVSDGGYSNHSASNQPPQRPPKEPLEPELPPKIRTGKLQKPSPLSNEHLVDDYEPGGSPRSAARKLSGSTGIPTRRPTGPRSMGSSKSGDLNRDDGTVRRNKNRDTFGTIASVQSEESETF